MLTNINIVPFVCVCVRALVSIMCVHMQDCLPVCLMFDMREEGETDPRRLNQMMQDLEVFISIKPKVKQTSKVPPPPTPVDPSTCIMICLYRVFT